MDIIEPTCTVLGSKKRECFICNYFETHEVEALGHEYTFTVVPPSVTDEGYTEYTCSNCGDTYTETITPYTGCLEITAAFRYSFEDITFYAPSAGHYVIYSTTNETIQFGVGEMGDDGYSIYESKYYMDVDAPGYITVQARYFPWSVPEGGKMEHKYVIYKVDDSACF